MTPSDHRGSLAATKIDDSMKQWQGFLIEMWATCILLLTIYGSVNLKRKGVLHMNTIPIGFAVALGIMSTVSV